MAKKYIMLNVRTRDYGSFVQEYPIFTYFVKKTLYKKNIV